MNKDQYKDYLKSDHWTELKLKKGKVAKRCWCCKTRPSKTNFHHVRYKQIYDVSINDLKLLCEDCHQFYHAVKDEHPRWAESWIWRRAKQLSRAASKQIKS